MATLINKHGLQKHSVSQYTFKSLGAHDDEHEQEYKSALVTPLDNQEIENQVINSQQETSIPSEQKIQENTQVLQENESVDSSSMSQNSKDALIESLMKKTDEMSSNFIKLQMKLEDKEQEFATALEEAKEQSFNQGVAEGEKKANETIDANVKTGLSQFANSITTLEKSTKEFHDALETIKEDLISAAIDIAKEVIEVELDTNASEVAKVLSDALIKELQGASSVTLKVNPMDHGPLSEHVGTLDNVQIISDSAVSPGGVIANSDVGNIDSQISERFEKVKRAALSE